MHLCLGAVAARYFFASLLCRFGLGPQAHPPHYGAGSCPPLCCAQQPLRPWAECRRSLAPLRPASPSFRLFIASRSPGFCKIHHHHHAPGLARYFYVIETHTEDLPPPILSIETTQSLHFVTFGFRCAPSAGTQPHPPTTAMHAARLFHSRRGQHSFASLSPCHSPPPPSRRSQAARTHPRSASGSSRLPCSGHQDYSILHRTLHQAHQFL